MPSTSAIDISELEWITVSDNTVTLTMTANPVQYDGYFRFSSRFYKEGSDTALIPFENFNIFICQVQQPASMYLDPDQTLTV